MTDKCREEFERWFKSNHSDSYMVLEHSQTGHGYNSSWVQSKYSIWQAAWEAARQTEQPAAPINQAYEG